MIDAMEHRRRKVFVPRGLAKFNAIRQFFSSAMAERATMKTAARTIPRLEAEVQALGRCFGGTSMGNADVPEKR